MEMIDQLLEWIQEVKELARSPALSDECKYKYVVDVVLLRDKLTEMQGGKDGRT